MRSKIFFETAMDPLELATGSAICGESNTFRCALNYCLEMGAFVHHSETAVAIK